MRGRHLGSVAFALLALAGGCSFDDGGIAEVDANAAVDTDDDGVPDMTDNCVDVGNAGQEDEDGDEHGNACDNCPHVVNADQANDGENAAAVATDDAGDACDPDPAGAGNDLLYFEGFDDPAAIDDWRAFNGGTWSVSDGALRQAATVGIHTFYLATQQFMGVEVATGFTLDVVSPSAGVTDTNRAFGSLLGFSTASGEGAGYLCLAYHNPRSSIPPSGTLNLISLRGSQPYQDEAGAVLNDNLEEDQRYDLVQSLEPEDGDLTCGVASTALPASIDLTGSDSTYDQGFLAVKTQYVAAHVDYVVAYAVPPAP